MLELQCMEGEFQSVRLQTFDAPESFGGRWRENIVAVESKLLKMAWMNAKKIFNLDCYVTTRPFKALTYGSFCSKGRSKSSVSVQVPGWYGRQSMENASTGTLSPPFPESFSHWQASELWNHPACQKWRDKERKKAMDMNVTWSSSSSNEDHQANAHKLCLHANHFIFA